MHSSGRLDAIRDALVYIVKRNWVGNGGPVGVVAPAFSTAASMLDKQPSGTLCSLDMTLDGFHLATDAFRNQLAKVYEGLDGGSGRNRTGVDGFAGRCITTLLPSRRSG